jgi:hypothetical protein
MKKFQTGQIITTMTIANAMEESGTFRKKIHECLNSYLNCNWGDLSENDKKLNDIAVKENNDRIFAAYETTKGKIYVITEIDRSVTTILFANEY